METKEGQKIIEAAPTNGMVSTVPVGAPMLAFWFDGLRGAGYQQKKDATKADVIQIAANIAETWKATRVTPEVHTLVDNNGHVYQWRVVDNTHEALSVADMGARQDANSLHAAWEAAQDREKVKKATKGGQ